MNSFAARFFQLFACFAGALSAQASGITFNITYTAAVQGDPNFISIQNAVNYVESEFIQLYADPVTLNFTIDSTTSGLGSSLFSNNYWHGSYAPLRSALIADATTSDDFTATADLSSTAPYTTPMWYATSAEAKALGLITDQSLDDGTFTFNRNDSYTYDPNNRQGAGKYDFIGVTEHEFSELMGRTSQDPTFFGADILDTMRFTAPGAANRQINSASAVYFSFDNGATNLAAFNGGSGDRQDLNGSLATDPFNASTSSNQGHILNSTDIRTMDAIGWDLVAAPEPGSSALVGVATLALAGFRVRRLKR